VWRTGLDQGRDSATRSNRISVVVIAKDAPECFAVHAVKQINETQSLRIIVFVLDIRRLFARLFWRRHGGLLSLF
jgi:hypothetical protein